MKKITTVLRDTSYTDIGVYEIPEGVEVKAGDRVLVEYGDIECLGVVTQNPVEIEDSIVAYFTSAPLRKITAIVTPITADTQNTQENDKD